MKANAGEVPPPGAGFVTVTFMLPTIAMSLAGIAADSAIVLMNVVVSDLPLKLTTDFGPKFAPFIVSVKPAPPGACVAPRLDIVGTGLFGITVNT